MPHSALERDASRDLVAVRGSRDLEDGPVDPFGLRRGLGLDVGHVEVDVLRARLADEERRREEREERPEDDPDEPDAREDRGARSEADVDLPRVEHPPLLVAGLDLVGVEDDPVRLERGAAYSGELPVDEDLGRARLGRHVARRAAACHGERQGQGERLRSLRSHV